MKLEYHTRVLKESSDFVLLYRYYILYILHLFFSTKTPFLSRGITSMRNTWENCDLRISFRSRYQISVLSSMGFPFI